MIEQLLCTHCTFRSSALEDATGDASNKVLGYSVRASSLSDKAKLRDEFRAIERLLSYDLPADAAADHKTSLDAQTAPLRLCFFPDISGRQVLGQLAYRQFDTANRPGSYFGHLLVGDTSSPWSAIDCLRLWGISDADGRTGWVNSDRADGFPRLEALKSLGQWLTAGKPWLCDKVVQSFLRTGTAAVGNTSATCISARWSSETSREDRTLLVATMLQCLLQNDALPSIVLAIEPSAAAVVFYAVIRMLPESLRAGMSFSTYESDPMRSAVRLVATTFVEGAGELRLQGKTGHSLVVNTFRRPWLPSVGSQPSPGRYAAWATQMLLEGKTDRLDDISQSIIKTWRKVPPTHLELDQLLDVEDRRRLLFLGQAAAMPTDLSEGVRKFLAIRCSEEIRRSIDSLASMPSRDAATLIQRLERIYRVLPNEWQRLKEEPAFTRWLRCARPFDEKSVRRRLVQPASMVTDKEAVELIISCDCVTRERRLPTPCAETIRLWGEFPASDAVADFKPPALFMKVLDSLAPESLLRLLPHPIPPLGVIVGLTHAIGGQLQMLAGGETANSHVLRLKPHFRRLLDDVAGDNGGTNTAATGVTLEQFESVLVELKQYRDFYAREPGDFGRRLTAFIKGLRYRPADVCADDRLVKLSAVWAECSVERDVLLEQIAAWKKLLSWFKICKKPNVKLPFEDYLTDSRNFEAEINSSARLLVPGDGPGVLESRRQVLHKILETYIRLGLLKDPTKKGLLSRFYRPARHWLADQIDQIIR
jgi:hypothetical protein